MRYLLRLMCPTCILAVGSALGFSHWLQFNSAVNGLWIGITLAMVSSGIDNQIRRRNEGKAKFPLQKYSLWFIPAILASIILQNLESIKAFYYLNTPF